LLPRRRPLGWGDGTKCRTPRAPGALALAGEPTMSRPLLTPLAALAFALAAGAGGRADASAKPKRTFEQHVTLTPLGDATVRLKWSLPVGDYTALQYRLGRTTTEKGKDGKLVFKQHNPTSDDLLHFLNLNVL